MARLYDETRVFHPGRFQAALDHFEARFPPHRYHQILEPGIGTGRIAIALAKRGYSVTGVDTSEDMLAVLGRRLSRSRSPIPVVSRIGDVTDLAFPSGSFDLAIVVDLFQFVREWQEGVDEVLRVVKPGHPLVLMHTGSGMEIPPLNDKYRELCAQRGHNIKDVGATGTAEVVAYLKTRRCVVSPAHQQWRWISRIRVDSAISYMKARAFPFTSGVPENIHRGAVDTLESEAIEYFGSLATEVEVPNQIYYVVVTGP